MHYAGSAHVCLANYELQFREKKIPLAIDHMMARDRRRRQNMAAAKYGVQILEVGFDFVFALPHVPSSCIG